MSNALAIELAKDFVQQEKKINDLISNEKYGFDVWEENGKAYVQTAICNIGGCAADYLTFNTLEEAKRQAAIMTITGEIVRTIGICGECDNEAEEDIYCSTCGDELMPVYDEHPNWLKYCSRCHYKSRYRSSYA